MKKTDLKKIIGFYLITNKLKTILRSGWLKWNVEGVRLESIAEHVFGTLMLATSICSNSKTDVNIERVALMLALHEMEEILIGDLTFYDKEYKNKKVIGEKAVEKLFSGCSNKEFFLEIINEFEARVTKEAKFAFMCDKLETDLQAYIYRKNYNYSKCREDNYTNERVNKYVEEGITEAHKLFLATDKNYYSGEFLELASLLEEMEKK